MSRSLGNGRLTECRWLWNGIWERTGQVRMCGWKKTFVYSASQLYVAPKGGVTGNHRTYEQNMAGLLPKGERKLLGSWVKM